MYIEIGRARQRTLTAAWRLQLVEEIRRDGALHAIIASYILVMLGLSAWFGCRYWLRPTVHYLGCFTSIAALILIARFGPGLIGYFARNRPRSPLKAFAAFLGDCATPPRVAGLFLYLSLAVFMGAFTTVKTILPKLQPFWFDPAIAALDRAIHGGADPWRMLHPFLGSPPITQAVEVLYSPAWLLLIASTPLLMAVFSPDRTLRKRYLLSFVLAWILNGTILAGIFMSGGPAFYQGLTGGHRYRALVDYLAFDFASPISAAHQQADLWRDYLIQEAGAGAGISAFPSMHVTMAVLIACAASNVDRRLGLALSAFAAVIVVGSVHLGWHYAVGSYFAVASSLALWWAVGRLVRTPGAGAAP